MAKKKSVQVEIPVLNPNQKIERKKISELKVNLKNAEIYPDEDIEDLKESILNNDRRILVPLVITPDGVIISGHRRYKAAIDLFIDEVNVIVEDVKEEDMEFRMIQYNVYRRKKYSEILREVDRLNDYFGKNQGRRTDLLDSEDKIDVNALIAKIVGLSPTTVSNLKTIRSYRKEYIDKIDEGKTSIVKAFAACKEKIKVGIEEQAIHTPIPKYIYDYNIYNKSCKNMREIADDSIQLIFCSPPYYKMRDYKGGKRELGQETTPEKYVENLVSILKDCYRVMKPEGSFFLNLGDCKVNGQSMNIPHKVLSALIDQQKYFHIQTIIWEKTNSTPVQNFKYLQPSYEFIFHLTKSMDYTYNENIGRPFLLFYLPQYLEQANQDISKRMRPFHPIYGEHIPFNAGILYDIWTHHDFLRTASFGKISEMLDDDRDHKHPAQMNSIVPIFPILLVTKPDDIVLDPFSGSGTTAIVALQLGCRYRGYEISQEYFETSIKKLNKLTILKDPIEKDSSK